MVLVDSSVWIEAARRNGSREIKSGVEGLLEEYQAAVCGLVWLEVLGGARPAERQRLWMYFTALPRVVTPESTWDQAALNAAKLRDHGITVPWSDLLVATVAVSNDVRVYACDQHFTLMAPHLGILLYEPGYGGRYQS
jgi:predicted nucleic acid-binding protein